MRRREFITLLGGTAATWPLAARAQQGTLPVIGWLSARSPAEAASVLQAFRQGLGQVGYFEGKNVTIEYRWAEGHYERLPALASDLVNMPAAILFAAGGSPSALAAKAATSTIPIVFLTSAPVPLGLVGSLNRPGGNVTGISNVATELPGKSLGLLKQTVPTAETIGDLVNPSSPNAKAFLREAGASANALGIKLHELDASTLTDLDEAFTSLARLHIGALAVMADPFFDSQRDRLVELSRRYRIAGCYPWREYVLTGGLMSYGTNLVDSYRQAAIYTGRILRGESPSTLPVMEPTKFEFVLNLKTARALDLTVPPGILSIADEVIE